MTVPAPRALVATDLDGTLLNSSGSISRRTREALDQADRAGIEIVFVTGRPPHWLADISEMTGHRGNVLCANGAMVYSLSTMAPVSAKTMTAAEAMGIVTRIGAEDPHAEFRTLLHRAEQYPLRVVSHAAQHESDLAEHFASEWLPFKMAIISSDNSHSPASFHRFAVEIVGELGSMTYSSHSTPLLEVGPRGVDKGAALRDYVAGRGIPMSHVHAIGDMPNDLPMLEWAPQSYAVSNAHPEVLATAGQTLRSNDEDAVARLLEELIDQI